MSLTEQQMLDVMAYADGELDGNELERLRALVETDAEAKELFASLRAIGDGVRTSFDAPSVDIRDVVMQKITPNDLDKARIRRIARTRMAVVSASLAALAAAVLFYVRDAQNNGSTVHTNPTTSPSTAQSALALSSSTGVEVDFVETPPGVSVFYVPADPSGAESTTEVSPSVVVWVTDDTPPKSPETTP